MNDQFHKELHNSVNHIQDSIAPYTRFVRSEQQKTTAIQEQIAALGTTITTLQNEIEQL